MPPLATPLGRLTRQSGPRNILLCFDAFDTLIRPRRPVPEQYVQVAEQCGLVGITPEQIQSTFRAAFKKEAKTNPNHGKASNLGATKWWTNVIHGTFAPLLRPGQELPLELAPRLLHRFSSNEGYELIEPNLPDTLRSLRDGTQNGDWHLVVGVMTNSDDRIPILLESLGLRVGPLRHGHLSVLHAAEEDNRANQFYRTKPWREAVDSLETVASRLRRWPAFSKPHLYGSQLKSETINAASSLDPSTMQEQLPPYDLDFTFVSYDVGHEKPDSRFFTSAQKMGDLILGSTLKQPFYHTQISPDRNYGIRTPTESRTIDIASESCDISALAHTDRPWLDWISILVGDDPTTDAAGAMSQSSGFWNCFILDPQEKYKPTVGHRAEPWQVGSPITQHVADGDHQGEHEILQIMGQNQLSFHRPKEGVLMRIDSVCDLIMRIQRGMKQPPEPIPQSLRQQLG